MAGKRESEPVQDNQSNEEQNLMSEQTKLTNETQQGEDGGTEDSARNNQENELEAEQESAEAMDAEVPQPDEADETTEGQPS